MYRPVGNDLGEDKYLAYVAICHIPDPATGKPHAELGMMVPLVENTRRGPGLLGTMARTAVIAGTASVAVGATKSVTGGGPSSSPAHPTLCQVDERTVPGTFDQWS